jgi:hypothetical protein
MDGSYTVRFLYKYVHIILWMAYKEQKVLNIIIWSILFVTTGAIATTIYILVQIFKLRENEPFENIFIRKSVN